MWPAIVRGGRVVVGEGGVRRAEVMLPTIMLEASGARLMRVLETVIAGPPGVRVAPEIMYCPAASAVMVWEPMVRGERVGFGRSISVLVPMIAFVPSGARLMRVLETVIAGPPGVRVASPSIMYCPAASAVMVWEPMVRGGRVGFGRSISVLVPMTAWVPSGARLMGVPETVIAGAPGMSV